MFRISILGCARILIRANERSFGYEILSSNNENIFYDVHKHFHLWFNNCTVPILIQPFITSMDIFLNDPHIFVDEDGKETKLTEMEYCFKTVAPVMDIVFSDANDIVKLRW